VFRLGGGGGGGGGVGGGGVGGGGGPGGFFVVFFSRKKIFFFFFLGGTFTLLWGRFGLMGLAVETNRTEQKPDVKPIYIPGLKTTGFISTGFCPLASILREPQNVCIDKRGNGNHSEHNILTKKLFHGHGYFTRFSSPRVNYPPQHRGGAAPSVPKSKVPPRCQDFADGLQNLKWRTL